MNKILIGTGGWGYFPSVEKPSLRLYSKIFNFVEVNSTFYHYPQIKIVENWRRNVPESFTFSVRCHQDLTHQIGIKPTDQAYEIFYVMLTYCRILKSPYLVLETPTKFVLNHKNYKETREFLSTIDLKGINLVWEYRAPITPTVTNLMQKFGIIQCIDLSRQQPAFNLEVTYSRLFGKGKHNIYQFTDEEIIEIDRKAKETDSKTIILSYHGTRMITDAARHVQYEKTGQFPQVTAYTGLESAKAVLFEDTKFPISKTQLTINQGWKVIDLTKDKRIHLSQILSAIPNKTYSNLEEVISEMKAII